MGYTHYFRQQKSLTDQQWQLMKAAATLLTSNRHCAVYIPTSKKQEKEIGQYININGVGDEAHESFVIDKNLQPNDFSFCKTARKSYDRYVTAILIVLNTVAPGAYNITSDGYHDEWFDGLQVLQDYLYGNGKLTGKFELLDKLKSYQYKIPETLHKREVIRVERLVGPSTWQLMDLDTKDPKFDMLYKAGDIIKYGPNS
jgi:uncharacterized protein Usg